MFQGRSNLVLFKAELLSKRIQLLYRDVSVLS